jgi:hypothetical protein
MTKAQDPWPLALLAELDPILDKLAEDPDPEVREAAKRARQ